MKIRNRLFVNITFSACALILVFMFLFLRNATEQEHTRYQAKIDLYAAMLPKLFATALFNFDNEMMEYLSNAVYVDPEINQIKILDDVGSVRLTLSKNMGGNLTESVVKVEQNNIFVGTIILEYSDINIQKKIRQILLINIAMIIAMLLGLGGMVFWTSFDITRPLYQIIDLVNLISAGKPEGEVEIEVKGELSTLLEAIQTMRRELSLRETAILKAKEEAFAHTMEMTLEKQQLEDERIAHQRSEALRAQLQLTLDELKETQEQLIMAEKMASLGSLVAGISHEINTPIGNSVITSSYLNSQSKELLTLLVSGDLKRSQLEDYARVIMNSTDLLNTNLKRAAELVRNFKQVSVDQTSEAERSFDLAPYLDSVVHSLVHLYKNTPYHITIECPENLYITTFPGAISQILSNFIMNSLWHGFKDRPTGQILVQVRHLVPNTLEIIYSDDGVGMDANTFAHHFEPFYTTLRNKGGSGLGAYIVYNLVTQRLKGTIAVESEPDKGIRYAIRFAVTFTDRSTCS